MLRAHRRVVCDGDGENEQNDVIFSCRRVVFKGEGRMSGSLVKQPVLPLQTRRIQGRGEDKQRSCRHVVCHATEDEFALAGASPRRGSTLLLRAYHISASGVLPVLTVSLYQKETICAAFLRRTGVRIGGGCLRDWG